MKLLGLQILTSSSLALSRQFISLEQAKFMPLLTPPATTWPGKVGFLCGGLPSSYRASSTPDLLHWDRSQLEKAYTPAGRCKRLSDQAAEIHTCWDFSMSNPEAIAVSDCLRLCVCVWGGSGEAKQQKQAPCLFSRGSPVVSYPAEPRAGEESNRRG